MTAHPAETVLPLTAAQTSEASPLEREVAGLFDQLRAPVLRYLSSFGLNAQDAEEVVQEVFLALFLHLRQGKPRTNLQAWIFRVAHNLGLKRCQATRRAAESDIEGIAPADPSMNPEQEAVSRQRSLRLMAVVRALPEQDRRCLYLRAEGLRYREIVEVLGMSLGAVAQSLERSLARLHRADGGKRVMSEVHIPHADLVAAADGELSAARAEQVRTHLISCWTCRTRSKEIEDTIASFVHAHQESIEIPAADAPRAMLRARLAELAANPPAEVWQDRVAAFFLTGDRLAYTGAGMAVVAAVMFVAGVVQVSRQTFRLMPDPELTPGATRSVDEAQVCASEEHQAVVPVSFGRQVFDRYGIDRPKARAYELDQLIAPELGGSDDPRNFWPQPTGTSEWNAHVKDALEDRLHQLVCENKLSLATAQHDISSNWIAAYKKYFQTQEPIASHRAFTKDTPWEP